jgi:hypothetical protein
MKMEALIQRARADCLIQSLRDALPPSSLWHEKRSALSQIEFLAITTSSGHLTVITWDLTSDSFRPHSDVYAYGNLGVLVRNGNHLLLDQNHIREILDDANAKFEKLLTLDTNAIFNRYLRLTCLMDFTSPDHDVNLHGKRLLTMVAKKINLRLVHQPFDFEGSTGIAVAEDEVWLDGAASAADFLFDRSVREEEVFDRVKNLDLANQQFDPRRIWATVADHPEIHSLDFVSRCF